MATHHQFDYERQRCTFRTRTCVTSAYESWNAENLPKHTVQYDQFFDEFHQCHYKKRMECRMHTNNKKQNDDERRRKKHTQNKPLLLIRSVPKTLCHSLQNKRIFCWINLCWKVIISTQTCSALSPMKNEANFLLYIWPYLGSLYILVSKYMSTWCTKIVLPRRGISRTP